ncbi:MAG: hypothetical protein NVS3B7_00830 [Candidatus Elarobacter sp.]
MSERRSDETDDNLPDASARRGFLSKSGMMLALLALAQGRDLASAAETTDAKVKIKDTMMVRPMNPAALTTADAKATSLVLNESIKAGKIDTASADFLKLSPAVQKSLQTLSPQDLQVLARAQQILNSRIRAAADDNNGTIGM